MASPGLGDGAEGGAPSRVSVLVQALAAHPGGLTGPELLAELRRVWPGLSPAQLSRLIADAGQSVSEDHGRYSTQSVIGAAPPVEPGGDRPLRAVAFDLEAIPRLVTHPPYVERAVWQVGAVRFGRDRDWVDAQPKMVGWMEIPAGYAIENPASAATHARLARAPGDVLADLADLCADADTLVAYNGTGLDFGELDAACEAAGLRPLDGLVRVDALYLAYAWWPAHAGHRLRPLAEAVGVDVSDLRWHDAADDAEALARLVTHGAQTVCGAFSEPVASLVATVGQRSRAWRLAFDLAVPARSGRSPDIVKRDDSDISAIIETELVGRTALRPAVRAGTAVTVPSAWRRPVGEVDPFLLSVGTNSCDPRIKVASQECLAAEVGSWLTPARHWAG